MSMEKAEKLKNKGNDELKKGNVAAAITSYTEALESH
jgi:outer membrane protein assembly factor BamD (BamD/ComL family)